MRVFGCAWKINFPEVIWSWLCKMRLWPRKWFEVKIFTSNHFRVRRVERERERERERTRGRRGSPDHAFDVAGEPRALVRRSHAPDCTGLIDHSTAPLNLAFDLASVRSCLRPTDLQPTDLFLWFWFLLLLWWCGSGVLVVVAFDCRSLLPRVELEFRWCVGLGSDCDLFHGLGFGCDFESFCNKICLDAEKIVEKMWKICRKIAFSE